jgi:hypothetical protein
MPVPEGERAWRKGWLGGNSDSIEGGGRLRRFKPAFFWYGLNQKNPDRPDFPVLRSSAMAEFRIVPRYSCGMDICHAGLLAEPKASSLYQVSFHL